MGLTAGDRSSCNVFCVCVCVWPRTEAQIRMKICELCNGKNDYFDLTLIKNRLPGD